MDHTYSFQRQPGETLLQPHEGIRGSDRADSYLLSLDERAVAHRDALIHMAYLLRSACTVGNAAPGTRRPADLDTRIKGFGYLVARRREWGCTDEQWESYRRAQLEGPFPSELDESDRMVEPNAWYIQYGPNPVDICRWENCGFMVLPVGEDFHAPAGTRNPDGSVTLNRDDIVGTLADSGIALKARGE